MSKALTDTLQTIQDKSQGNEISFDEINKALEHRGFGPLLIAPALIAILPTGAIPGIPALCAIFIILISSQFALGRQHPWLPKRLKNISFSKEKYKAGFKKAKTYTEWIDQFFHPRFEFLIQRPAQRLIAILCVLLAMGIIVIGFIPFAAALPSSAILLFGLGLSVRDGLLTAIGFIFLTATIVAIPFLF